MIKENITITEEERRDFYEAWKILSDEMFFELQEENIDPKKIVVSDNGYELMLSKNSS